MPGIRRGLLWGIRRRLLRRLRPRPLWWLRLQPLWSGLERTRWSLQAVSWLLKFFGGRLGWRPLSHFKRRARCLLLAQSDMSARRLMSACEGKADPSSQLRTCLTVLAHLSLLNRSHARFDPKRYKCINLRHCRGKRMLIRQRVRQEPQAASPQLRRHRGMISLPRAKARRPSWCPAREAF